MKKINRCFCGNVAEDNEDMCYNCKIIQNLEAELENKEANKLDWG